MDVFSRVDVPGEMLTDMGNQFTLSLMKKISRQLCFWQLTSSLYHPICNGLVECINGSLKQMLRRPCAERIKDWDRYINPLLFAYKKILQESL